MIKTVLSILLFFIINHNAEALTYHVFSYKIKNGDSLASILKKFVDESSVINSRTPFIKQIIKKNTHIKSWTALPAGARIKLYISSDHIDPKKYLSYQKEMIKNYKQSKVKNTLNLPTGFRSSIFYLASLGSFTQSGDEIAEINFKQNSPFSLGVTSAYYPKDKAYAYSGSLYYSYLLSPENLFSSEKVTLAPEIGANFYVEYKWPNKNYTIYAGADYEKFSVFNPQALQSGAGLYSDEISLTFLTLGLTKGFSLFNKQFISKIAFSKSLLSSYKDNAPSPEVATDLSEKYNGFRVLLYLNYKLREQFYLHSLFKYHTLSGPSDLTAVRVGLGFGYVFF